LAENRACTHKERNLTPSMHHNLKAAAKYTHADREHRAERHIGKLRDGGISEARFEIILPQRDDRGEDNGNRRNPSEPC